MKKITLTIVFTFLIAAMTPVASNPAVPTMGWSSWNTYRVDISDSLIMAQADAMATNGLRDAGYEYINIDDGYFGGRDRDGNLKFHPSRFPHGLKPVVDHIHALGLKAGIYSDAGRNTCGNFWDHDTIAIGVGLLGHEERDCRLLFDTLGFDFIKIDFCGGSPEQNTEGLQLDERTRYAEINRAVRCATDREVRINVCRWAFPGTWAADVASSWRISADISDSWRSVRDIIRRNLYLSAYCRSGRYNDMDMLEVGRSLTPDEERTHFGLWCMMSSPLLIGCDLTSIRPESLKLLTNPELIALNQDTLALQAYVATATDGCYLLVKDLVRREGPVRGVAVYNPTDSVRRFTFRFADIDLDGEVSLRDLFDRCELGAFNDSLCVDLPPHATRIYRAEGSRRTMRKRYEAETAFIPSYQELTNATALRTGEYVTDAACSGAMKAASLGGHPDSRLVWDMVTVPSDGVYTIIVAAMATHDVSACLQVNGEPVATLTFNDDSPYGYRTFSFTARFHKGRNIVTLSNDTAPMPDIDYIDVLSDNNR